MKQSAEQNGKDGEKKLLLSLLVSWPGQVPGDSIAGAGLRSSQVEWFQKADS